MKKLIEVKKSEFQKLFNIACEGWKTKFTQKFEKFLFEDFIQLEENYLNEMQFACDAKQLKVFKEIFKDFLKNKEDLFDITTYKDVCKALGEKLIAEDSFSHLPAYMINKAVAQAKIQQLEKLFNGDWVKDWNNQNQRKWYPYFEKGSSGWSFRRSYYYYDIFFGSAGFYKDQATSDHIGKNFIDVYIQAS